MWYKGSQKWVSEFKKAKTYNRKCDASNAITTYRDYGRGQTATFEIYVYEISQTIDLKEVIKK